MMKKVVSTAVVAGLVTMASAECPNGCNGHGKCTSYDMCICNRNWQANDCSERVCQFGLAHVDTPKGDLDMSGDITGPDLTVAENSFNYPYGTAEQFPQGRDSDLREVTNSAHYYMECSNKGTCNRDSGECECFPGYDGAACQRASCPGYPDVCSGHGVCKSIRQLAAADNDNIYELWDKHSTMGCECDEGFDGPDCSQRKCKYGIDPLYYDDSTTIKYATWDFGILTSAATADFTDGMVDAGTGYFAIRFFDMHGEDWVTEPIAYGSDCATVTAALEALPNEVIPAGSLSCFMTFAENDDPLAVGSAWSTTMDDSYGSRTIRYPAAFWEFSQRASHISLPADSVPMSGTIYRIKFAENPGALQEPEIEIYLDGKRASIATADGETLITPVWTDGQQGESVDYFADICAGVTATLSSKTVSGHSVVTLGGLDSDEVELLKACLGASNFDVLNNVEKYDWDYGDDDYPHLIKLVLTTASSGDGGYYAAVFWDSADFVLMNQFVVPDGGADDNFDIYTTKGTLARVSSNAYARFGFASHEIITQTTDSDYQIYGDVSCEINDNNAAKADSWTRQAPDSMGTCLNKTDIFTFLSTDYWLNPTHINLYTVDKIYQKQFTQNPPYDTATPENYFNGTFAIETNIATNYAARAESFFLYKFFPSSESTYTYVAECSNRGICNEDSGLCECFHGYTNDDCSSQNSLAV
eukprot:CAMPEP_0116931678 /NCGR_PEP_ID=MMETSP0467-20121206/27961_1 /TAXON_ID=283647 /ORGANISM="Mesodinium pulex, Strain SPMC105" /LENGTH=700 /DNA_ID=CAMNT_0004612167 /DNA_START=49 /DNA_END=2151 /DNA_ORIENTATION=+